MIIMSVDFGDVRTGLAVCDKMQILASPVCVITEKNRDVLVEKIAELAKERKAERICVGLPQNMDGSYGFRSDACRELGKMLEKIALRETIETLPPLWKKIILLRYFRDYSQQQTADDNGDNVLDKLNHQKLCKAANAIDPAEV